MKKNMKLILNSNINNKFKKLIQINCKYFGGHHEYSGKVDLHRSFVPTTKQEHSEIKGLFNLTGLNYDKLNIQTKFVYSGEKNFNNHNPFDILNRPKNLSSVSDDENPYLHNDFYGYNISDDVSFILYKNIFNFLF